MARGDNFGQWIRERRSELRISATEAAARAGMKPAVWSNWENGRSRRKDGGPTQPRRETVRAIAEALMVPANEAFAAAGYGQAESSGDAGFGEELELIFAQVPSEKRPAMKRAVRRFAESIVPLVS